MAAALTAKHAIPLTPQEAVSGIFGSISLAAWIVVLVPQFIENYRNGNADAVSLPFLVVWFIGDIANLIGAIWASLVPTVIVLAIYFCCSDLILLSQSLYYRYMRQRANSRKASMQSAHSQSDEEEPLLSRRPSQNMGLPGSRRRSSGAGRRRSSSTELSHDPLSSLLEEDTDTTKQAWTKNAVSILLTCIVGAVGWAIAWQSGAWTPAPTEDSTGNADSPLGAQILGYFSAVCYLTARIPQIYKNWADKSTAGLSLLFFLLSILGNVTYGAGILFHSLDKAYIIKNIPWLIGSFGTIAEDLIIGFEFYLYGGRDAAEAVE